MLHEQALKALSPIQRRILELLSDGLPHERYEVLECLGDSEASLNALRRHIRKCRDALERYGHTVICELRDGRRIFYRHVRLLTPASRQ